MKPYDFFLKLASETHRRGKEFCQRHRAIWDNSMVKRRALKHKNVGLNPGNDGLLLRVFSPHIGQNKKTHSIVEQ